MKFRRRAAQMALIAALAAIAFGFIWPILSPATPKTDQASRLADTADPGETTPLLFAGRTANIIRACSLFMALVLVAIPVVILMTRFSVRPDAFSICLLLILLLASALPRYLAGFGWTFLYDIAFSGILHIPIAGAFAAFATQVASAAGPGPHGRPRVLPLARIRAIVAIGFGIAMVMVAFTYEDQDSPWILLAIPYYALALYLVIRGSSSLRGTLSVLTGAMRRQFLWLVQGLLVGCIIGCISVFFFPAIGGVVEGYTEAASGEGLRLLFIEIVEDLGATLAIIVVAISVNISILARGAFDSALKMSTVYGILTPVFAFLFAAIESTVSDLVEDQLSLPRRVGPALAGGGLALVFLPVKAQLEKRVVRIMRLADPEFAEGQTKKREPASL